MLSMNWAGFLPPILCARPYDGETHYTDKNNEALRAHAALMSEAGKGRAWNSNMI